MIRSSCLGQDSGSARLAPIMHWSPTNGLRNPPGFIQVQTGRDELTFSVALTIFRVISWSDPSRGCPLIARGG